MTTRELNIKNRTHYFYNDLINLSNFEVNNLTLDKKTWKDIDLYYIGYVDKDNPPEWNVNSVNPLYSIIIRVYATVSEENGAKYLKIDKGDAMLKKFDQVFSETRFHIREMDEDRFNFKTSYVNFNDGYDKIKFLTDDSLPLDELIYLPALAIIIRYVF